MFYFNELQNVRPNAAAIIVYLPNGDWAIQRNKRSVFKEVKKNDKNRLYTYTIIHKNEGKSYVIK